MRGRLGAGLVATALALGCTTPYRIDAGSGLDAGRLDAGLDGSVALDGGRDSPDTPDAFTCAPSCLDATQLVPCAGAFPIDCDLGCIDGPPAHCGVMVVANVDDALATAPSHGDVVAMDGAIDTGACTWPGPFAPIAGQLVDLPDGRVCLFAFASLTIPGGVELHANGPHPLVIVSEGEVRILGDLHVDSLRAAGSAEALGAGSGTSGAAGMPGPFVGGGMSAGGGGGGFATGGGQGGAPSGGMGGDGGLGASYLLEPLVGGARGGAGGSMGSAGGPGGGAMQISSRTRIDASGYLGASGGGGARGSSGSLGGAGGGSGGAILLEAPEIVLGGDVNVSGGGGGSGSCSFGSGTAGEDGAHQTGAPSGGAACPIGGGAGGRGAGGTTPVGGDAGSGGGSAGGGGGGAGVVRIRVHTALTLPGAARFNPRVSAGLYTVDPLSIR